MKHMQGKKTSNSISRGVTVSVLLCFDGKAIEKSAVNGSYYQTSRQE